MSEVIYEIRDYTIAAEDFPAYKVWANSVAGPWLKANLDVLDFWMDAGIEAEVAGSDPKVSPHGQANVCWIIRWPSLEDRRARWPEWTTSAQWQAVWAEHPNPNAYLHMNARFMKGLDG